MPPLSPPSSRKLHLLSKYLKSKLLSLYLLNIQHICLQQSLTIDPFHLVLSALTGSGHSWLYSLRGLSLGPSICKAWFLPLSKDPSALHFYKSAAETSIFHAVIGSVRFHLAETLWVANVRGSWQLKGRLTKSVSFFVGAQCSGFLVFDSGVLRWLWIWLILPMCLNLMGMGEWTQPGDALRG